MRPRAKRNLLGVALLGGVKVSLSIKSRSMRSHEASPSRSLSMGRSSNLSMQYVFLLLIVLTTTQAFMLGYQDRFPIATRFEKLNQRLVRRYDSHHDPREIPETQQPRYLKISKMSHFQSFLAWKIQIFCGGKNSWNRKKNECFTPKKYVSAGKIDNFLFASFFWKIQTNVS